MRKLLVKTQVVILGRVTTHHLHPMLGQQEYQSLHMILPVGLPEPTLTDETDIEDDRAGVRRLHHVGSLQLNLRGKDIVEQDLQSCDLSRQ
jgi:hypothetical protein